ncbi:hypothetical protein D1871_04595 [Nakamurella silvestris]|nr:hypothetical protein D1871_04595 [Nakamurella silvestris]
MSILIITCGLSVAVAMPAAAEPPATAGDDEVTKVDNTRWPKALNWVIPGTAEFNAKYMDGKTTASGDSLLGCGKAEGGNPWAYTQDMFENLGTILDAQSTATGSPVMQVLDSPIPTAPWPGLLPTSVKVGTDGGVPVVVRPGKLIDFESRTQTIEGSSVFGACGKTFARYGTSNSAAPFGFGFYQSPDQGSIEFFKAEITAQGAPKTSAEGTVPGAYSQYWGAGNSMSKWNYSPLDYTNYCADEKNLWCATASFLRCPAVNGSTPAEQAAIRACRTWNANVILLNQYVAVTLFSLGVGMPANGRDLTKGELMSAIGTPGKIAPLDAWISTLIGSKDVLDMLKWVWRGVSAALVAAGFFIGGIPGLLITSGIVILANGIGVEGIFGAVSCATDMPRCVAGAGSDALVKQMSMIPDVAQASTVKSLQTPSWSKLFNTLATISLVMLTVFFMISLIVALVRQRPSLIWESFAGMIEWWVIIGLGGVFLTAFVRLRDQISTMLAGTGGGTSVMEKMTKHVTESLTDIAADKNPGTLLAGIAAFVGTAAGWVVWVVLKLSEYWVPLVIGILILQIGGRSAPGTPKKWMNRGLGVLWALLLIKPVVLLIYRVGMSQVESDTGYAGLFGAVLMLLVAACAPALIGAMFALGSSGKLGLGPAVLGGLMAGKALGGGRGSASRAGKSSEEILDDQLDKTDTDSDTAAGGGGKSGSKFFGGRKGNSSPDHKETDPTAAAAAGGTDDAKELVGAGVATGRGTKTASAGETGDRTGTAAGTGGPGASDSEDSADSGEFVEFDDDGTGPSGGASTAAGTGTGAGGRHSTGGPADPDGNSGLASNPADTQLPAGETPPGRLPVPSLGPAAAQPGKTGEQAAAPQRGHGQASIPTPGAGTTPTPGSSAGGTSSASTPASAGGQTASSGDTNGSEGGDSGPAAAPSSGPAGSTPTAGGSTAASAGAGAGAAVASPGGAGGTSGQVPSQPAPAAGGTAPTRPRGRVGRYTRSRSVPTPPPALGDATASPAGPSTPAPPPAAPPSGVDPERGVTALPPQLGFGAAPADGRWSEEGDS